MVRIFAWRPRQLLVGSGQVMLINVEGAIGRWQRELGNYTVGLVIALIQLERAKRYERRVEQSASGELTTHL